MSLIDEIRQKIVSNRFEYSKHAVDQSIMRRISVQEVREATAAGMVIEDYPADKYGPSCLIYGPTLSGRPIHLQCSYPTQSFVKIITLYEPDSNSWIDFKTRRPK